MNRRQASRRQASRRQASRREAGRRQAVDETRSSRDADRATRSGKTSSGTSVGVSRLRVRPSKKSLPNRVQTPIRTSPTTPVDDGDHEDASDL